MTGEGETNKLERTEAMSGYEVAEGSDECLLTKRVCLQSTIVPL
jgi:hypothetical protein